MHLVLPALLHQVIAHYATRCIPAHQEEAAAAASVSGELVWVRACGTKRGGVLGRLDDDVRSHLVLFLLVVIQVKVVAHTNDHVVSPIPINIPDGRSGQNVRIQQHVAVKP